MGPIIHHSKSVLNACRPLVLPAINSRGSKALTQLAPTSEVTYMLSLALTSVFILSR